MFALDVEASVVENENNSHTAQLVNLAVELERGSFFYLVLAPKESHHPDILRTEEDNLPLVECLPVVPSTVIHVALGDVVELVYVRF